MDSIIDRDADGLLSNANDVIDKYARTTNEAARNKVTARWLTRWGADVMLMATYHGHDERVQGRALPCAVGAPVRGRRIDERYAASGKVFDQGGYSCVSFRFSYNSHSPPGQASFQRAHNQPLS